MIKIHNKDCFKYLPKIESNSIDCIITDPPYFLSNDGVTCKSGKMVSVNKGEWDKGNNFDDVYNFNAEWINCLLYTSPSPRDRTRSRMPSSA